MKDATELYQAMLGAVYAAEHRRQTTDPESPLTSATIEAAVARTFALERPQFNVVSKPINLKWAAANVLHFFARTEEAGVLRKYNDNADRFLTGDRLIGAYGPIAVPQIERCIQLLAKSLQSRRAVASMGGLVEQDINRPPCWSLLHFLYQSGKLHLAVYQRSLNLAAVMPYDCVLLTNVLLYAAERLGVAPGCLHWTVGSLHVRADGTARLPVGQHTYANSIVYDARTLSDPRTCMDILEAGL